MRMLPKAKERIVKKATKAGELAKGRSSLQPKLFGAGITDIKSLLLAINCAGNLQGSGAGLASLACHRAEEIRR